MENSLFQIDLLTANECSGAPSIARRDPTLPKRAEQGLGAPVHGRASLSMGRTDSIMPSNARRSQPDRLAPNALEFRVVQNIISCDGTFVNLDPIRERLQNGFVSV